MAKATDVTTEPAGTTVEPTVEPTPIAVVKEPTKTGIISEAEMDKVTKTTAELLAEQPKVKVKLFLPQEERKKLEAAGDKANWPFETVQINGHNFQIQKGVTVEVPQSVYEILEDSGHI